MKYLFYLPLFLWTLNINGQTGLPATGMTAADNLVESFMYNYGIPGLTFAMSKNGKMVYLRSFGYSDLAESVPTQPYNLFRIASLSKQITSIAIMKLIQDGQFSLSSKVFGPGGLLEHHPVISTATIIDSRIYNITVQQLLEHTAGWDASINCNANPTAPYPHFVAGCDPINNPLTVTLALGLPNPVTEDAYCKYMLQMSLNNDPGVHYAYSNMGYLFLGEIIEQVTGMTYEEYVKTAILHPLGLFDTHIGGNLLSEKKEREAEYIGYGLTNLSIYGDGTNKLWEYGGMNLTAMSAHGGWITTARDLLTLLNAVDGFSTKPDILNATTIGLMTQPSTVNQYYAKGWQVNSYNNWWHTGGVPGSASEQVRASNGYNWVIIMNHRNNAGSFWSALDYLGWNVQNAVTWASNYDLMLFPTVNASGITFSNVTENSMTVNWNNGNGSSRLLAVSENSTMSAFPLDGTDYTANTDYTSAPIIGSDVKIVYNGTGSNVNVTGLQSGKTYYFRTIEYNKSSATGNNALYLLGGNPTANRTTSGAQPVALVSFEGTFAPNTVDLKWTTAQEINSAWFEIERSEDGNYFSGIGTVAASGNSQSSVDYAYSDNHPLSSSGKLFYRLRIVDKDGAYEYSNIVVVNIPQSGRFTLAPNPARDLVTISAGWINTIEVRDISGKLMTRMQVNSPKYLLDVSSFQPGIYVVSIADDKGLVHRQRLVVRK